MLGGKIEGWQQVAGLLPKHRPPAEDETFAPSDTELF
jgi:hypothetical protein